MTSLVPGSMCNKQISLHCIRPEISLCFDLQFILYAQSPSSAAKRGVKAKELCWDHVQNTLKYLAPFLCLVSSLVVCTRFFFLETYNHVYGWQYIVKERKVIYMFRSNYCYTVELKRLHLAFVDGQVDRVCTDFGSEGRSGATDAHYSRS